MSADVSVPGPALADSAGLGEEVATGVVNVTSGGA